MTVWQDVLDSPPPHSSPGLHLKGEFWGARRASSSPALLLSSWRTRRDHICYQVTKSAGAGPRNTRFAWKGVKEKPSPAKRLVLQRGKTWLEKGRRAVVAPRRKNHPPCIRQQQIEPAHLQEGALLVLQLHLCCSLAEVPTSVPGPAAAAPQGGHGEAQQEAVLQPPWGKLQQVCVRERDLSNGHKSTFPNS